MNPSSFTYLDNRRWGPGRQLLAPPALDRHIADCPEYDDWHYGLTGPLTPYVAAGDAPGRSLASAVGNYVCGLPVKSFIRYTVGSCSL